MNPTPKPRQPDDLASLFPAGDYRFHMRTTRQTPSEFFAPGPENALALAERRRWLHENPEHYLAASPESGSVIREWARLATSAGIVGTNSQSNNAQAPDESLREISVQLEPDLLFLAPADGEFRLIAGAVCFPSSWGLAEKIGRTLPEIHGVVPGLNAQLGPAITQFLRRLTPGSLACRENWGLSASPERNQHPERRLPRLTSDAAPDAVWLRIERQSFMALPESGSVCFAIRIDSHPLAAVKSDPATRDGLERALSTMPDDVATYKGIADARARVLELLRA